MADNWDGAPQTWSNETFSDAKLNREIRDRFDAIKAGLLDASADADIVQSIKSGTLAARSGVAHLVGRQYAATDLDGHPQYISTGTAWEHAKPHLVYDSFDRANTEPLIAESGHTWTENEGDIDIVTSTHAQGITLAASRAMMTVDTGGIVRSLTAQMMVTTGAVAASINVGFIIRRDGAGSFLKAQLLGGVGLRIGTNAVDSASSNPTWSPNATDIYYLRLQYVGSHISIEAIGGGGGESQVAHLMHGLPLFETHGATGTSVGVFVGNTQDVINNLAFTVQ